MEQRSSSKKKITRLYKIRHKEYGMELDQQETYTLSEDALVSLGFYVGQELDEEMLPLLAQEEGKKEAERLGLRYLSYRPRTVEETRRYLHKKDINDSIIESCIHTWSELGYLNDQQFAISWVKERIVSKKKGRHIIQQELLQKGIDPSFIEEAFHHVDEEQELESCLQLAIKRASRYQHEEEWKARQKLGAYLQRRGYPINMIQAVLHQVNCISKK